MKKMFYDVATELDEYKRLQSTTGEQIHSLLEYLNCDEYSKYFFAELENPVWVVPLYENGLFSNVPPPLEDPNSPGFFSMPTWYAGEYLKKMADKYPDIVKDVVLSIDTVNSRAMRTLLEALLKIPANVTAETVVVFRRWSETPFANFMILTHEMGLVLEYLSRNGQVEASLKVLEILLEPQITKYRGEEEKIVAGTRHDFYWLNKACQENLQFLNEIDPIGVVGVAERQLIKAIDLEYDPGIDESKKKLNSFWRLSISPRSDLNYDSDLKNLLVNTIIIALNKAYEQKNEDIHELIAHYIESEYSIFNRIGVYMLRAWGKQYPDLLEKACIRYIKDTTTIGNFEFQRLLEDQFGNLPEFAQKKVLERINDGPDPGLVDRWLKQRLNQSEGETPQEIRSTLIERWKLGELDRISANLVGAERELYIRLLEKHGKPPPSPEEGVEITSWEGPESPIELDELGKKSINDVVKFLLGYVPSSEDSFGVPSREGLGRILEDDVQNRANDYADNSLLFINDDLPFVYHIHYLRGLENAVKNHKIFSLAKVITICEYITNQEKDKFKKQELEEGLPAAKLAVAQLFEELLKIKDPYIVDDLLERSGQIIVKLMNQQDPFFSDEAESGFDPAMRSLNSIHGMAMHCIVLYGLYCERKRKIEKGGEGKPVMVPLVKETLTEKLDKTRNPSQTIHSVFGWYYPQFIYLDKEWALENRERIFPAETEMVKYWRAAWCTYVRFSDVYTNVFPELIKQYQRALEELSTIDGIQAWERIDEKIATHILKAYLLDMIKIDSEDGLISLYYKTADDETRSHGNFWLSQAMEAQKPSVQDAVWQRIWSLWQWRIEEATTSENRSNYVKEISNFCRLLKHVPLDLSEMYPVLQRTLGFIAKGYELGLIINYLGDNCEKYPDLAVSLLNEIVLYGQSFYLLDDIKNSVRKIITSVLHADLESKAKAIEIINIFGERGNYEWRPLLDGLRE